MIGHSLNAIRIPGAEIIHYASSLGLITSKRDIVQCQTVEGSTRRFHLKQEGWKKLALPFRPLRRLLRLDKVVVCPVEEKGKWTALIAIRGGKCYYLNLLDNSISETLQLRQSRNPLHQSICRSSSGNFFHGEYGSNPERVSVPVYKSSDNGKTWEVIFEFPAGKTRHIHGCFWDPYEKRVWVCTGDFENENHVLVADEDFNNIEWLGDGTQSWRTCHPMFTNDAVYWGMDSQLETSYICMLDRSTRTLQKCLSLPGPAWYSKQLSDGWLLVGTAVEKGPGVYDNHGHIFASKNGKDWLDVYQVKKDIWQMPYFKNGVINFADGDQTSQSFFFSAEGFSGIDGKVFQARIDSE